MRELMSITKALADEHRVRALLALRHGELCVCQITELFGLAPSTISKHLSVLQQAGLVESRKEGRWMYYRLPAKAISAPVKTAISWLAAALERDEKILADSLQLKQITKMDPVELCKRQCRR